MEKLTKQICFLTYINRSGSTLLSKELNKYKAIGVSLEAEIRDGIHIGYLRLKNKKELKNYLQEITNDSKFRNWNLNQEKLYQKLKQTDYPINFQHILLASLEEYFKERQPHIYIYKRNDYFRFHKQLRSLFPGAKFIFISRDPRSIFNSQKKSIDSIKKKPMSKSIVQFAVRYKKTERFINQNLAKKPYFMKIIYEDFVQNKNSVISKILKFLKITNLTKIDSDYYNEIPKEQQHLHQNLKNNKMNTTRIDAWKKELEPVEIDFLQRVLSRELKINNYISVKTSLTFNEFIKLKILQLNFDVYYSLSMLKKAFCGY